MCLKMESTQRSPPHLLSSVENSNKSIFENPTPRAASPVSGGGNVAGNSFFSNANHANKSGPNLIDNPQRHILAMNANGGKVSHLLFPKKLRLLLDDAVREGNEHIVSWLPNGRGFKVHKPEEFTRHILKIYFRQSHFKSFTRQLYHYGFSKIDAGENRGAFYHPQFHRDDMYSCLTMERKNARKHIDFGKGSAKNALVDSEVSSSFVEPYSIRYSKEMIDERIQPLRTETEFSHFKHMPIHPEILSKDGQVTDTPVASGMLNNISDNVGVGPDTKLSVPLANTGGLIAEDANWLLEPRSLEEMIRNPLP